jgi:WD40 repeat protein
MNSNDNNINNQLSYITSIDKAAEVPTQPQIESSSLLSTNNNNNKTKNAINNNNAISKYELTLFQKLERHEDKVWHLNWHPLEDLFASCGSDKNICIWGVGQGSPKYSLKAILEDSHSRTIRSVAWDYSGTYLASASFDSLINIWKKSELSFECVATLEGHENEVKSVSWSISGSYLATCSRDKTIWIWDFEGENDFSCNTVLQGHTQDVKMVKWSPVEDILFSCSYDNTIKVWKNDLNEEDWVCANTLMDHSSTIWSIYML